MLFSSYEELENYFYYHLASYYRKGANAFDAGTEKMQRMLSATGNPHKHLGRIIHLAGTNGKGSTLAILDALLQSAGLQTASYTSPHIFYLGERIKISGKEISRKELLRLANETYPLVREFSPTFFELITLLAFVYFARKKPDFSLIETGLGGRLDATNVVDSELAIITSVSYDHTAILGNTLEKISFEKAGIIKENSRVIASENPEEVLRVLNRAAKRQNSIFYYAPAMFSVKKTEERFLVKEGEKTWEFVSDLTAEYQAENFETAFSAFKVLGFSPAKHKDILKKIRSVSGLIGRWEILSKDPFIVADPAHNEEGLKKVLREFTSKIVGEPVFLLAFVKEKNLEKLLSLFPENGWFFFVSPRYERMVPLESFKKIALRSGLSSRSFFFEDTKKGFEAFWNFCKEEHFSGLITGSFYHLKELLSK